jgi:hypothetical protein
MATGLKNITKMGTDVRKIAALLQKKAPPGHMLAYISEDEAQLLKDRGGSGRITEAGIPSFELDEDLGLQGDTSVSSTPSGGGGGVTAGPGTETPLDTSVTSQFSDLYPKAAGESQVSPQTTFTPGGESFAGSVGGYGQEGQGYTFQPGVTPIQAAPADNAVALQNLGAAKIASGEATDQVPTKLEDKGMSDQTLKQLGIAGLGTLLGASQIRKAQAQGQAGAQQLQALATPYQQQGQALQAQAQAGTLTPAGQQSLQALQAQMAQGVQARGGVGVAQAAQQVEALRQQLLAQQYQLGLQLSGIGDNIAKGAIQTGMQADQYANQLTSSYFNNIARIAAGTPTSITIPTGGNP